MINNSQNRIKNDYVLGVTFAIAYFFIARELNECSLFRVLFGSADLGYKMSGWASFSVWIFFAIWAVFYKKFKLKWKELVPVFVIVFYFGCVAFSTGMNDLGYHKLFTIVLNTMSVLFLIIMACDQPSNARLFIASISWLYLFFTMLNALSILFGDLWESLGIWGSQCFIGNFDTSGFAIEMGMFYALLDEHLNKTKYSKAKFWVFIAVFYFDVLTVLHVSGTTVIAAGLIAIFLVFKFVRRIAERTNLMVFFGISLVFFASLMWFAEPIMNSVPVSFLLKNVFHKSLTLTGRLDMWPWMLAEYIYLKPVFGYGIGENSILYGNGRLNSRGEPIFYYHTHNQILQTWYDGGLVTLAVIIVLFIVMAIILKKCKDRKLAGVVSWMLFVFLIVHNSNIINPYNWTCTFEIMVLASSLIYAKE